MSVAEFIYVDGMAAITLAFPTLLVVLLLLDQARGRRLVPVLAAQAEAHPPALRRAA